MSTSLLSKLEKKVEHTVEVIELLRLQIEELEEENAALKAEQEKWRADLSALLQRFDDIEVDQNEYEEEVDFEEDDVFDEEKQSETA
jgi:cell division protein ZapB